MADDRQRCLDAGADGYLSKPFSPLQLMETVEAALLLPALPT